MTQKKRKPYPEVILQLEKRLSPLAGASNISLVAKWSTPVPTPWHQTWLFCCRFGVDCVVDEVRNFTLEARSFCLRGDHFGEGPMNRNDQYLSYAAEYQQMDCMTRNEHERQVGSNTAQSWPKLVQLPASLSAHGRQLHQATPKDR